ncbi:ATP-dependent zinc metalloprotease FtsH [bioreactor metagenome]|uniref:ATP-dependent zinc metalloprotease FtsH n=1 Tax=bioreactor metagenome TaxID=1076179 RepID=A0A645F276_9ZZZZ
MSESVGPMFLGGQEEVFIAKDWGHQRNYSESLAATVDSEVRVILETQFARASSIISENMEALDRVSEMLIEYERVTGEEFMAVFNGTSPAEILKKATPKRKRKKPEATPAEPLNAEVQGVPV